MNKDSEHSEDHGLEIYKNIVDNLVIPEFKLTPDGIEERINEKLKGGINTIESWASLTPDQKQSMAVILNFFASEMYEYGVTNTLGAISHDTTIVISGTVLPREPYGENIAYDFVRRNMGIDWPEERVDL